MTRDALNPIQANERELRWHAAVVLWLRWNEAYEHATAQMYVEGQSQDQLQARMDQMDQLRAEAIKLSRELLGLGLDEE